MTATGILKEGRLNGPILFPARLLPGRGTVMPEISAGRLPAEAKEIGADNNNFQPPPFGGGFCLYIVGVPSRNPAKIWIPEWQIFPLDMGQKITETNYLPRRLSLRGMNT